MSELLAVLQSGWLSVGKTRARGTGRLVNAIRTPKPVQPVRIRDSEEQVFVITLRGPTLMLDPRECLEEKDGHMKNLKEINALYAQYWCEVSNGVFTEIAERRFKIDSLIGGFQAYKYRYCADRSVDIRQVYADLQPRIEAQKKFPYNPTLIVEPGSVFVLKVTDNRNLNQAQATIAQWLSHGLPLPDWVKKAYGDTHHTNVFLPQNGYGEIDVNLPSHAASFSFPLTRAMGDHYAAT